MDDKEHLKNELWKQDIAASLNEHYYQKLAFWAAVLDRTVRISVGVVAIFALAWYADPNWSWGLALASLAIAVALNILPVFKWELDFRLLQSQWGELRGQIQAFEVEVYNTTIDLDFLVRTKGQFAAKMSEREADGLAKIVARRQVLHSRDVIRWQPLIDRTYLEERQRRYGKGVRTAADEQRVIDEKRALFLASKDAVA